MAERTEYRPGTFSWAELATPDPQAAKAFYGALFGWEALDRPDPDGGTYTFLLREGRRVAGTYARADAQPEWLSHVTVEDVDAAAARVRELGGAVLDGPNAYGADGRMVSVADPAGAALVLWQPGEHVGAEVVNEPGTLIWNDLATPDFPGARSFYEALFGWTFEETEREGAIVYATIKNGDRTNGGVVPLPRDEAPARWTPYFAVEDCDGAVADAEVLGARMFRRPMDVPAGRMAVLHDPRGAVFAVFAGRFDD